MVSKLQAQFMPERNTDRLADFRVTGWIAIRALIRELVGDRALIAVYSAANLEDFVVSQVVAFDEHYIDLDFVTDDARRAAISSLAGAIVVGFLDHIKIQFPVSMLTLVQRTDGPALRCPTPDHVYRIQRRESFRVRPPVRESAVCFVRHEPGQETAMRIIDLSAGGAALELPADFPRPEPGTRWQHCRLEVHGRAPIPCDIEVRHVTEDPGTEGTVIRLGCVFLHLPSEVMRSLQLAVIDFERKARR